MPRAKEAFPGQEVVPLWPDYFTSYDLIRKGKCEKIRKRKVVLLTAIGCCGMYIYNVFIGNPFTCILANLLKKRDLSSLFLFYIEENSGI